MMKNFDERLESIRAKSWQLERKRRRRTLAAMFCMGVFVTALLLTLFVPYSTQAPSVSRYQSSPYYEVIQKLNVLNFKPPQYKNNFQMLLAGFNRNLKGNAVYAPTPDNNASNAPVPDDSVGGTYVEVTDNQVAGVIEADLFKRTDKAIFHLHGTQLSIYSIAGEDSMLLGKYSVDTLLPLEDGRYDSVQMYLSVDGKTLTLVAEVSVRGEGRSIKQGTVLMNLDVSEPEQVQVTGRIFFDGCAAETRMVGGNILMTYLCYMGGDPDYSRPETFVPRYGWFGELQCMPAEDILCPDKIQSPNYSVIVKLDGDTLELLDSKALLSYSHNVYMSREHIFAAFTNWKTVDEDADGNETRRLVTDFTCIGYTGDSLEVKGSFTVEGSVKDQYSMDEHEGTFRVVTSTSNDRVVKPYEPEIFPQTGQKSANLYIIDMSTWEVAGKVEGFAPQGEEVTSVRFEGKTAYVCTALRIYLMDPVYFFDLTEPANIHWTDTGEIDGFSTSLVNFGNGNLVGIGYNDFWELKIEVYREIGEKVEPVCAYEPAGVYGFSEDYKSYYIDRENQRIGLAVQMPESGELQYVLLHFDGEQLVVERQIPIPNVSARLVRADIIDGWLYILSRDLTVTSVTCQSGKPETSDIKGQSSAAQTAEVVEIMDISNKKDGIPADDGLFLFYADEVYDYFYYGNKSEYVRVRYSDGSEKTVEEALKTGDITMADLDEYGIVYLKYAR